ncbi:isoprenoid biosynthesis glyoxalase ElbB [Maricurvus nonylphenolicus]|uniref:isoprenoid biosynthesis glyoxalase ElbB n=1 Tax=Maricurvus nonylphenolicus TaxID=1008307 RepID=UPI0036F28B29
MSKRVAVVLAGCGVYDGSEIYESVITLLRLDQQDAQVQCFAPNIDQMHVINHATGEETGETRNVLQEAARLARGEIKDLAEANANDFDALIVPGGFGAAKNLSDFAVKGAELTVNEQFVAFAQAFKAAGKPVGLVCIAPVMSAAIFGEGVKCTIGQDAETAAAVNATGAQHQDCVVEDIVIDEANKLVTTPAYMLASRISETAAGINKLVDQVLAFA